MGRGTDGRGGSQGAVACQSGPTLNDLGVLFEYLRQHFSDLGVVPAAAHHSGYLAGYSRRSASDCARKKEVMGVARKLAKQIDDVLCVEPHGEFGDAAVRMLCNLVTEFVVPRKKAQTLHRIRLPKRISVRMLVAAAVAAAPR